MNRSEMSDADLALSLLLDGEDFDEDDSESLALATSLAQRASDSDLCARVAAMLERQRQQAWEEEERDRQLDWRESNPLGVDELLAMIRRHELPPYGFTYAERHSLCLVPENDRREAIAAGRARPRWRWDSLPGGYYPGPWEDAVSWINPDAEREARARQRTYVAAYPRRPAPRIPWDGRGPA